MWINQGLKKCNCGCNGKNPIWGTHYFFQNNALIIVACYIDTVFFNATITQKHNRQERVFVYEEDFLSFLGTIPLYAPE